MRFTRDEWKGEWGTEVGEEGEYIPIATLSSPEWYRYTVTTRMISLHCHHQNDCRYTITTTMTIATLSPPQWLSLHCHHQNDSCIKMGSDESHFNVSVESDGQSHKTTFTNHNLFEEKGEPKRNRTEALLLTSLTPYRQAKPAHN